MTNIRKRSAVTKSRHWTVRVKKARKQYAASSGSRTAKREARLKQAYEAWKPEQ